MATSNPTDSDRPNLIMTTNYELLAPEKLEAVAAELEKVAGTDLSCHNPEFLAEHSAALKRLEDAAEEARKEGYEDELDDRVDEGETVGPLRKQSGRNTWITDTEGAFAAVAEAGEDPLDVAEVGIRDLRDVLGDAAAEEFIDEASYEYFVRR